MKKILDKYKGIILLVGVSILMLNMISIRVYEINEVIEEQTSISEES